MAVTAREVLLIFRGQNYLSSAIRRVGADVGGLSRTQQLANQRAQLQIVGQRIRASRSVAQSELTSVQAGARRLAQEKAVAAQKVAEMRSNAALLRQEAELSRLNRLVKSGVPARGLTMGETVMMRRAAELQVAAGAQSIENAAIEVQRLEAAEAGLREREAQLTQIINTRSRALDLNNVKLAQNRREMNALPWQKFADGATKVEHAGRVFQMFGLITTAAMGYAADAAAKFNTQVTLAATQATIPGQRAAANIQKNAREIQNQLQSLLTSGRTTASPSDLTNAAYNIYSSVTLKGNQRQQIQQGIDILKQFNRVLTANYGMVDLNQVTQAGVTIMNDFGASVKTLPHDLNTMQAAVRYGRITMEQFLGTFGQVAPSAKAAGYSFDQMASTVAFLSRKFPSAQQGAVGYARLLELLARNADKFNKAGYQVTNKAGTQLLPLQDIVKNILARQPELAQGGVALQNFFKTITGQTGYIRSRQVFTFLAQDLGGYQKMVKNVTGDQNELNRSINALQKSPAVRLEEFKNQLRGVTLELGAGAIPAFRGFVAPIEAAVKWFDQLNPRTQRSIGYFIALAGILTLLGGTFLSVVGMIGRYVGMIGTAIKFMGNSGLAGEAGFVNLRLGLMLGVIGLVIYAMTHWHQVSGFINHDLGGMSNAVRLLGIALAGLQFTAAIRGTTLLGRQLVVASDEAMLLRTRLLGLAGMVVSAAVIVSMIPKPHGVQTDPNAPSQQPGQQFLEKLPVVGHVASWVGRFADILSGHRGTIVSHAEAMKEARTMLQQETQLINNTANYAQYTRRAKTLFPPEYILSERKYNELLKDITNNIRKNGFMLGDTTKMHKAAARAAKDYGTTATVSFRKAYEAYLQAERAAKADPQNYRKQLAEQNTLTRLQSVASKQQLAAARQTATAQSQIKGGTTAMLQEATQDGIIATQAFARLYAAVIKAERAMAAHPDSFAAQRSLVQAQKNLDNYVNSVQNSNKQIASSTQETFQSVVSNVESMYQSMLSTEQNIFGTLFQGPFMQSPQMQNFTQFGGIPTGKDLVNDLGSQLRQFRQFHAALDKLRRQGAPEALIQQLEQLGPSALKQIQALTRLSRPELQKYFRMFGDEQKMINRQTLRDLNRQLSSYKRFGRNMALAMVAGLKQESPAIERAIKKMIMDAFPGLRGSGGAGGSGGGGHQTHHHHHDHTHIHGNPTQDQMTRSRHQSFRNRHRHRRNRFHGDRYGG